MTEGKRKAIMTLVYASVAIIMTFAAAIALVFYIRGLHREVAFNERVVKACEQVLRECHCPSGYDGGDEHPPSHKK